MKAVWYERTGAAPDVTAEATGPKGTVVSFPLPVDDLRL